MIVVDASAICAMVLGEPERDRFGSLIAQSRLSLISPLQVWEAAVTISRRTGDDGMGEVERTCARLGVQVATLGASETRLAFEAWRTFGKGRHPARLNLGDCFAYALAKSRDLPLLFKGGDFAMTDIRSAL